MSPQASEVDTEAAVTNSELPKSDFGELDIAQRFQWIRENHGGEVIASTSAGAQAAVMLHLLKKHAPEIPIVFVDTGYHFPETYQYLETLKDTLEVDIEIFSPQMTAARQEALYGKLWGRGKGGP